MNSKTTLAMAGIVCLVAGFGGGYYARGLIRPARIPGQFANRTGQPGQNNAFRNGLLGGANGRPIAGSIQTVGNGSLTIKTPDGSSRVVLLTSDTTFNKMIEGSAADFTTGTQVIVTGQEGTDGSVTATSIQAAPNNPPGPSVPSASINPLVSTAP